MSRETEFVCLFLLFVSLFCLLCSREDITVDAEVGRGTGSKTGSDDSRKSPQRLGLSR